MFTQKTIDFLAENRLQNSKVWYAEHKSDYQQYAFTPMAELVTALTPVMQEIDGLLICEPKVDKSISRIYRDTRFSKDKSLYREVMWCVFIRDKKLYEGPPAFFFELSPTGFRYGCGYYMAGADSMESLRQLILKNDPTFQKALATFEKQDAFVIEGDRYKRSKYPDMPENLRNWLDRKSLSFIHNSTDFDMLFSDRLADILAEGYKTLAPLYHFLITAEARKI